MRLRMITVCLPEVGVGVFHHSNLQAKPTPLVVEEGREEEETEGIGIGRGRVPQFSEVFSGHYRCSVPLPTGAGMAGAKCCLF